jgi:hypothetical protein
MKRIMPPNISGAMTVVINERVAVGNKSRAFPVSRLVHCGAYERARSVAIPVVAGGGLGYIALRQRP